jgi:pyruvate,orthophosphate dikinase
MAEDPDFPLTRAEAVARVRTLLADPPRISTARSSVLLPLTTGLGASPGLASGPIVTDPEAAVTSAEAGTPTILVRAETSPDDVHGMARAAGILTTRGGLASHAAVVARGWGIPAVVGAADVHLLPTGAIAIGARTLAVGDVITIDGASGEVFEGAIPGSSEVVPEARILLGWARELGIAIDDRSEAAATPVTDGPVRRVSPDRCLQAIAIKGFATAAAVADAVRSTPDIVEPIVDQLAVDGLIAPSAGAFRLTDAGTARASALTASDRATLGEAEAAQALDDFLVLDRRMKDTVTAWQLRDPDAQVFNDHSDADYDRGVLDRLAGLHADTVAWITPLETLLGRLTDYRERLTSANDQAQAGDGRFVASPRVDSYHGIWFELHEDLIRLAGRTRAEEAEAGRA